jgi:gluconolactonase
LYTPLDHRDLDFFGLYHLTPKGRLEAISRTQTRPNGVTLSPDGKILYVADTDQKKILAYDLDRHGRASHQRVVIDSGADGIRTDKQGNLYLAEHGVLVYSPQGKLLGKIQPQQSPRNIAFGDSDLRTLYMIGPTLYRVRLDIPGAVQY